MLVRFSAIIAVCVVMMGMLSSCSSGKRATAQPTQQEVAALKLVTRSYRVRGKRYVPMSAQQALKHREEGVASYYECGGARGALGERLRSGEYYAAHKTLPMPCRVRITNLSNGKTCEARIADRGPFSHNRIIDVSRAVARKLDFMRKGVQKVRVEVVSVGDGPGRLKAE